MAVQAHPEAPTKSGMAPVGRRRRGVCWRPGLSLKPQLDAADGAFGRDDRHEATTLQARACKEERQSRTPDQTCQQPRSATTQRVKHLEGATVGIHATDRGWVSGQLRF